MKTIRDKMMLSILPSVGVLFLISMLVIGWYFYSKEKDSIYNRNLLTAKNYSAQISSIISRYNAMAETLTDTQMSFQNQTREEVSAYLRKIAEKDEWLLATWLFYDLNAFDGKDKLYIDPKTNKDGRFSVYWNRMKGILSFQNIDFANYEVADWYRIPKETGKPYLTTPYIYEGVILMSFCYPILKNGKFLGLAGTDLSLENVRTLLEKFEDKKKYKSNKAILISKDGILISTSNKSFSKEILDKKKIQDLAKEKNYTEYDTIIQQISAGEEGFVETRDVENGKEIILFFSPVQSANLGILISISKSDLLFNTMSAILILGVIAIISIVLVAIVLYFLIHTITDPLNKLNKVVTKFGERDFTQRAKIETDDEISDLANNFNTMADSIQEYSKQIEDVTREKTRVNTEMEIARTIQTSLLTESLTLRGYKFLPYMQTADEVGGDYYDVIKDKDREWLVIGDVSGHGVTAGLIMMMAQTAIHTVIGANYELPLDEKLKIVNKVISDNIKKMKLEKYMTLTMLLKQENKFHFAGMHQDILVYRKGSQKIERFESQGAWLGMADYLDEFPVQSFTMESGDILILYTDGVTESMHKVQKKMLETSGLAGFLEKVGHLSDEEIKSQLVTVLQEDYSSNDDITFMIVRSE